jgi:hypothetical protein
VKREPFQTDDSKTAPYRLRPARDRLARSPSNPGIRLTPGPQYVLLLFLSTPETSPDTPAAPDPTRSDERLAALKELADRAMDMTRMIHAQAQEAFAAGQPVDDLRFTRVTRAVRQIFALEAHLEEDLEVRAQKAEARRIDMLETDRRRRVGAKSQTLRSQVEGNIHRETGGAYAVILQHRLYDWLDRRSHTDDFLNQPIEDLIAAIKRDIGLDEVEAENAELAAGEMGDASEGPVFGTRDSRDGYQGRKGHEGRQGLDSS